MEWRCAWCGKPHEANDPPCDNCGHGHFERAVRPLAPEGEGGPTVWVCTECGRDHPRNNPPCSRCGAMTLERREQTYEEGDPIGPASDVGTDDEADDPDSSDAVGGDTMTVWACTECGRAHPRNNPPCSRCGGMTFEQRVQTFDDAGDFDPSSLESVDTDDADDTAGGVVDEPRDAGSVGGGSTTVWECTACGRSHTRNNPPCSRCGNMELERRVREFDDLDPTAGGWLDALDTTVLLGFVGATALLALLVATTLGIVTLPGATPATIPAEDVPGDAESAHGLDLATVETSYVTELDDRRAAAGLSRLDRSDALDDRATWYNRRLVQAAYTDASRPTEDELNDAFDVPAACGDRITFAPFRVADGRLDGTPLSEFDAESTLAAALVDEYVGSFDDAFTGASSGYVGVDVHVGPDDAVFVTQFVC